MDQNMYITIVLILVGAVLFVLLAKRKLGALRERLIGWIAIVLGSLALAGGVLARKRIGDFTDLFSIGLIVAGLYYAFRPRPNQPIADSATAAEQLTHTKRPSKLPCPQCGKTVWSDSVECKHCKARLPAAADYTNN